jgi:hypothetical protein
MPAPEPPRKHQPAKDLSAVPAFLRKPGEHATGEPSAAREPRTPRPLAMPRPVTPGPAPSAAGEAAPLDPASLPMPSLSRRRVITAAGVLVASLMVVSFARQVGEASAASTRAAELRTVNAALPDEVARLQGDLDQVQDPRFISIAGRAFGLGGPKEIPFALAAGAPPLAADAPGSAAVRLGAEPTSDSPVDAWLEVLFGAGP